MALTASRTGGNFTPVPPGTYLSRCYRIVDMGTQKTTYKGKPKLQHKIMIQWEVHGEDDNGQPIQAQDGNPLSISKNYTLSLSENAQLFKDLTSWRGRAFTGEELNGFELKNVLGAWCMISVIHEKSDDGQKTYANITSVTPVPTQLKKAGLPEGQNKLSMFDLDNPDMEMFESFSDNLQAKIKESPEWRASQGDSGSDFAPSPRKAAEPELDDDIPF